MFLGLKENGMSGNFLMMAFVVHQYIRCKNYISFYSQLNKNGCYSQKDRDLSHVEKRRNKNTHYSFTGRQTISHEPFTNHNALNFCSLHTQIVDNHVIRYVPPDIYHSTYRYGHRFNGKYGIVIVGAERVDPQRVRSLFLGI